MSRPRILILADCRGWAWQKKSLQLVKHLSDQFDLEVVYHQETNLTPPHVAGVDLVHTFEMSQTPRVAHLGVPFVTGITAHVYKTWGDEQVKAWASQAQAFHANSMMLYREMLPFHEHVYYVPNGVDPTLYYRERPRRKQFCGAYVGKQNPRKGLDIIKDACRAASVPLKLNTRRYTNALDDAGMCEWYQDAWVQITASDMDGTPCPMLESAACENCLVSNPIGNMPEMILHGKNGYLVERTAQSIAEKLIYLKAHPDLCIEMGRQARKTVLEDWTWAKQAQNYAMMWTAVLSRLP